MATVARTKTSGWPTKETRRAIFPGINFSPAGLTNAIELRDSRFFVSLDRQGLIPWQYV
jgi:hypothetical protein